MLGVYRVRIGRSHMAGNQLIVVGAVEDLQRTLGLSD